MRLVKPTWMNHRGRSISAISISHDMKRVATCGDNHVRIWNMDPVLNEAAEADPSVHKLLASLFSHSKNVSCLRWSPTDQYLASGGDDMCVMLYERHPGQARHTAFGTTQKEPNIENWVRIRALKGHTLDVDDLCWSPDGRQLVSCSRDNTAVVWSAETFEQVLCLEGHRGFVQGVAWDPAGDFIATASTDRTVRVWRARDGELLGTIQTPSAEESFFRRLGWSPDGQLLTCSQSRSSSGAPCAMTVSRGEWEQKDGVEFIGHERAVVVARYSPRFYQKPETDDSPSQSSDLLGKYSYLCAVGSQDCSISLWSTSKGQKPLVILTDAFAQTVADIAWGSDGHTLACCSMDGTVLVAVLSDEQGEIDPMLSEEDSVRILRLNYGANVPIVAIGGGGGAVGGGGGGGGAGIIDALPADYSQMVDDKYGDGDVLMGSPGASGTGNSAALMDSALASQRRLFQPSVPPPTTATTTTTTSATTTAATVLHAKPSAAARAATHSEVVVLPDGRRMRRIQPVQETEGGTGEAVATFGRPFGSTGTAAPSASLPPPTTSSSLTPSKAAFIERVEGRIGSVTTPFARTESGSGSVVVGTPSPSKRQRSRPQAGPNQHQITYNTARFTPRPTVRLPALSVSGGRSLTGVIGKEGCAGDACPIVVARNHTDGAAAATSTLRCTLAGTLLWRDALPSACVSVSAGEWGCACACADGTVWLFSRNGRRLCPAVCVGSVALACVRGRFAAVVTCSGIVWVWEVIYEASVRCTLRESIESLVADTAADAGDAVTIVWLDVTVQGLPVVECGMGRSFVFDSAMKAWVRVADGWYSMSEFYSVMPAATTKPTPTLRHIQHHAAQLRPEEDSDTLRRMIEGGSSAGVGGSGSGSGQLTKKELNVAHLENQLCCALSAQSPAEYKSWLAQYVKYLCANGMDKRVAELCEALLGPYHVADAAVESESGWQPRVMGSRKRDLLRGVLGEMRASRSPDIRSSAAAFQARLDRVVVSGNKG